MVRIYLLLLIVSTLAPGCGASGPGPSGESPPDDTGLADADRDGFFAGDDCDDSDPRVHPGAKEPCGSKVDLDCDGVVQRCETPLDEAGTRLGGVQDADDAGWSVVSAGDLDGDGLDDVLVGVPLSAPAGLGDAGSVAIVPGPADEPLSLDDAGGLLLGENFDDHAGWAVAGGGSLPGGQRAVLVGAPWETTAGTGAGAVYLVAGPVNGDLSLSDADTKLVGPSEEAFAGNAVAFGGDVYGDGSDDLLVAAIGADGACAACGVVYVVPSPSPGTAGLAEASSTRILGDTTGGGAGQSVAFTGDMNGDGLDDVLVGAPAEALVSKGGHGSAYLFMGPVGGDLLLSSADAVLAGDEQAFCAGYSVAGGSDANGDGTPDLLVGGACGHTSIEGAAGRAWLVLGPVDGAVSLAMADATLVGEHAAFADEGDVLVDGDQAGRAVAFGGDVNGDDRIDLLVGAPWADQGERTGAAYVVFGPISGTVALGTTGTKLVGGGKRFLAGNAVAAAGDTNGDGLGDFLVGVPGDTLGDSQTGAAYRVAGGSF